MDPRSEMLSAYGAAIKGDWKNMIDHYHLRFTDLALPVTFSEDTALHIAVCSKKQQPLKDLLDISPYDSTEDLENPWIVAKDLLTSENMHGNTVLHEATIYGNFEAVKLLVQRFPDLVSITNGFGETPLFTAAEFAEAEIVQFLLESLSQEIVDHDGCLLSIHRQRSSDNLSILSAAIIGQQYETALMLLELDESLHSLNDKSGINALQLLSHTPSAFKSGYPMGILEGLIYCCLPVVRRHKVKLQKETSGQARQERGYLESDSGRNRRVGLLNYINVLIKGYWPVRLQRFWNEKRKHAFALTLAEILIKKDMSWNPFEGQAGGRPESTQTTLNSRQITGGFDKDAEDLFIESELPRPSQASKGENPLFTATKKGIIEIVRGIIEQHPQAIEYLNDKGQSILDVAVMHRNKEIFSLVTQKKIPLARLRRLVDNKGNTSLHHVADMEKYSGGTKPGPALQLQEELRWFEKVRNVIPSHYVTLLNKEGKTAEELFETNHQDQLKRAQKWMKETTQSCSTVAALVATVVFAAAYTVPGGSDDKGTPNFINSPYFMVFTVSDVISLASSLTSLVVFLSLLTSPFELEDFRVSLPRKLIIGFTFLFFSVITTMLSFGATILIVIQSEKKLTTSLLSIAAFFPVLVFAILQFRLYVSFMGSTLSFRKIITKALPSCLVRRLSGGKKRW